MFYLGIDIGKNTHVASLMNHDAKIVFKAFSFSNTLDDAKTLLEVEMQHLCSKSQYKVRATSFYGNSIRFARRRK